MRGQGPAVVWSTTGSPGPGTTRPDSGAGHCRWRCRDRSRQPVPATYNDSGREVSRAGRDHGAVGDVGPPRRDLHPTAVDGLMMRCNCAHAAIRAVSGWLTWTASSTGVFAVSLAACSPPIDLRLASCRGRHPSPNRKQPESRRLAEMRRSRRNRISNSRKWAGYGPHTNPSMQSGRRLPDELGGAEVARGACQDRRRAAVQTLLPTQRGRRRENQNALSLSRS